MSFRVSIVFFLAIFTTETTLFAEPSFFKVESSLSSKGTKKGQGVKLFVTLTALEGTKINEEAPLSLEVKLTPELTATKSRFQREDAQKSQKQEARWEIPLTASKSGNASLSGILNFYLCTDKWCRKFESSFTEKLVVAP